MTNHAVILDTPDGISFARLASCKGAVRLESKGMKMSRGVNVTKIMRQEFGLKARAPHDEVIAAIQKRMDELVAKRQAELSAAA